MELQRLKLENIKQRLLNGEKVINTRLQGDEYFVQLSKRPEIRFGGGYRETVENTIRKAGKGVRENTLGPDVTISDTER